MTDVCGTVHILESANMGQNQLCWRALEGGDSAWRKGAEFASKDDLVPSGRPDAIASQVEMPVKG